MKKLLKLLLLASMLFYSGCFDTGETTDDDVVVVVDDDTTNDDTTDDTTDNVVDTPTVLDGDIIESNDSGLKTLGDKGNPPLHISNEEPTANTQVSITAGGVEGGSIEITIEGSGCGTVQNTNGTSPLTITGTVGSYGDCNISASYTDGNDNKVITGRFIVAATEPDLPPINSSTGAWIVGGLPTPSTDLDSAAKLAVGLPIISSVEGPLEFINGGSSEFTVHSSSGSNISAILVKIDSFDGYYHVPVYTTGNSGTFKLSFDSDFFDKMESRARSAISVNINITIIDDLNQVSAVHNLPLDSNETGFGDVKVSISWNTATDVDLHVTDPNSTRTYYGNKTPGNGSTLDLDSNAGCDIDGVNNENIYWDTGTAISGEYTVLINMWSLCEASGASGTVTMIYNGDDAPRVESWSLGSSQTYTFTHGGSKAKVSGKITYEDFPVSKTGLGDSRMLPVRFAEVQVVRDHDDEILATGLTNASGEYVITFENDDLEHAGYYVMAYARQDNETLKQEVLDYAGKVYTFKSSTVVNEVETPEKEDMNIAITKDKNAGAMNIFDVGVSCNNYARINGGKVPEKLTFKWQVNGTSGSYYSSTNKRIVILGELADPDEYDDIIIGHEYGHFVMDTYSKDNSPGGEHSDAPSTATLAWSEGWATFFAAAALNKSFYLDTTSSGIGAFTSVESLPSTITLGNVGDKLDGDVSEAVISAVLWDLHDNTNETFDSLGGKSTGIWKVLTTYLKGTNFKDRGKAGVDTVDFLDGWFCLGYGSKGFDGIDMIGNVWFLHDLSYDFKDLESCK